MHGLTTLDIILYSIFPEMNSQPLRIIDAYLKNSKIIIRREQKEKKKFSAIVYDESK